MNLDYCTNVFCCCYFCWGKTNIFTCLERTNLFSLHLFQTRPVYSLNSGNFHINYLAFHFISFLGTKLLSRSWSCSSLLETNPLSVPFWRKVDSHLAEHMRTGVGGSRKASSATHCPWDGHSIHHPMSSLLIKYEDINSLPSFKLQVLQGSDQYSALQRPVFNDVSGCCCT